jgi:hypothetical protein
MLQVEVKVHIILCCEGRKKTQHNSGKVMKFAFYGGIFYGTKPKKVIKVFFFTVKGRMQADIYSTGSIMPCI